MCDTRAHCLILIYLASARGRVLLHTGEMVADTKKVADILAEHFSQIARGEHLSIDFLNTKRIDEQILINFTTDVHYSYNDAFDMRELRSALSNCKSTAEGPDGIHYEMLKHLPEETQEFLLKIFNRIWVLREYPNWNFFYILPFKKPGKSGNHPGDYRPIALTSCLCKLLERMVNVRFLWYLERKGILSPFQFGFRRKRSTIDILVSLETYIREAFVKNEFVTAIFFDLEKAYDTTWQYYILKEIYEEGLRGNLPIFIQNLFKNRNFKVRLHEKFSEMHTQHGGVPQGGVLSTTCFLLAIDKICRTLPFGVRYFLYVDDLCICLAGKNIDSMRSILQTSVNLISTWTDRKGFKFSDTKTSAVTFSRHHHIERPRLTLYNQPIQYKDQIRFLGLTFDPRLTFLPHIQDIKTACTQKLNLLKVLSHTSWGSDRKTLLRLHNTLVLSKLDYGCQIYGSASKSYLDKLDAVHHAGLRVSIGAFKSTPVMSLYSESGFYSLDYRRSKICMRYFMRISTKYSNYLERNVNNLNSLPEFEAHPRYRRPFDIRIHSILSAHNLNPVICTVNTMTTEPWQIPHVELCQDLLILKKSEMTDIEIRCLFTEHFTTHRDCIPIFTDGSKSDKGVVYAAVFPNQIIKRRLPYDASIFTAELMAILTSLKQMLVQRGSSFVIASDSQSALKSITSFHPEHSLVIAIQELLAELHHKQKCVKFCWVPSHVGIQDNERADKAAKLAIVERQITNISLPYKDLYSSIDMKVKAKALQTWLNISNSKLRNIKSCIQ